MGGRCILCIGLMVLVYGCVPFLLNLSSPLSFPHLPIDLPCPPTPTPNLLLYDWKLWHVLEISILINLSVLLVRVDLFLKRLAQVFTPGTWEQGTGINSKLINWPALKGSCSTQLLNRCQERNTFSWHQGSLPLPPFVLF